MLGDAFDPRSYFLLNSTWQSECFNDDLAFDVRARSIEILASVEPYRLGLI